MPAIAQQKQSYEVTLTQTGNPTDVLLTGYNPLALQVEPTRATGTATFEITPLLPGLWPVSFEPQDGGPTVTQYYGNVPYFTLTATPEINGDWTIGAPETSDILTVIDTGVVPPNVVDVVCADTGAGASLFSTVGDTTVWTITPVHYGLTSLIVTDGINTITIPLFISAVVPIPAGYCNVGVWFDFAKLDAEGLPCAGEIDQMNVAGCSPLRGPGDDGNFIWTDALIDNVGFFGLGYSDFGRAISTTLAGRFDFFIEEFGPEAPLCEKIFTSVWLLVSLPTFNSGELLTFNVTVTADALLGTTTDGVLNTADAQQSGSLYGSAIYGTSLYSGAVSSSQFQRLKVWSQQQAAGVALQVAINEVSIYPWTLLGYIPYVSAQKVSF